MIKLMIIKVIIMKGSEKLAVYVGTFVFVLIGWILSIYIEEFFTNVIGDLGILTGIQAAELGFALTWFVVCLLTYWGSTRWLESGERAGILSIMFFVLWAIASLAMIIGFFGRELLLGNTITIDLDTILDGFFYWLLLALSPTISALLGVSNKASRSN